MREREQEQEKEKGKKVNKFYIVFGGVNDSESHDNE